MMMNLALLLAAALSTLSSVHACGEQVLFQNFDKYSGAYQTWTKPMGKEDFPGFIFLKFDDFAAAGEGQFRVENVKGCVGTAKCGATFDVKLPPMEEATLTYKFKHSPGYQYGLGGKLPGLCSLNCPSGCTTVDANTGFSARVMWRESNMMSYSYYAGMTQSHCGENWYWDRTASAGSWHTIKMYIKVNSPGQANGAQTIEYDGSVVYSANDILWAQNPLDHPIEKFTFRSFHGGGSAKWASAQDQYIYFDDISVNRGKCVSGGAAPLPVPPPEVPPPEVAAADQSSGLEALVEPPPEVTLSETPALAAQQPVEPVASGGDGATVTEEITTQPSGGEASDAAGASGCSSSPPGPGFRCNRGRWRKERSRRVL